MVAFPEFFEQEEAPNLQPVIADFSKRTLGEGSSVHELALLLGAEVLPSEHYIPNGVPVIREALLNLLSHKPVHLAFLTNNGMFLEMRVAPKSGTWNASYLLANPSTRIPELEPLERYNENVFRLEEFPDVMIFVFRTFFRMAIENGFPARRKS